MTAPEPTMEELEVLIAAQMAARPAWFDADYADAPEPAAGPKRGRGRPRAEPPPDPAGASPWGDRCPLLPLLVGEELPTVTPAVRDADRWLRTDPSALRLLAKGVRLTAHLDGGAVVVRRGRATVKRFARKRPRAAAVPARPTAKQAHMRAYLTRLNTLADLDRLTA